MIDKETTSNISILFKTTRKFHRLQQTEFSAILGVTQGTISKIESGLMSPELGLWFKFLKAFNIQDPYCFTYAGIEFNESAFQLLKSEGSALAPKYSFKDDIFLLNVRKIRPLFDFVLKYHAKALDDFLKSQKIGREIFYILNHPLSAGFVDSFFSFLDENKISSKSILLMDLNFDSALGREMENLRSMNSSKDIFTILNNNISDLFQYEASDQQGEYIISLKSDHDGFLQGLNKSEFILNYNILYPFHYLKFSKNAKTTTPLINEVVKDHRWHVQYA